MFVLSYIVNNPKVILVTFFVLTVALGYIVYDIYLSTKYHTRNHLPLHPNLVGGDRYSQFNVVWCSLKGKCGWYIQYKQMHQTPLPTCTIYGTRNFIDGAMHPIYDVSKKGIWTIEELLQYWKELEALNGVYVNKRKSLKRAISLDEKILDTL